MNEPLTELQQFFGAYFNQDWAEEHSTADEVIDAYLLDSSRSIIIIVKQEILDLMSSYSNEQNFQEQLLGQYSCYYYYPNQWTSGPIWLSHIVRKFDEHLLKT